jgi:hypothetical protein
VVKLSLGFDILEGKTLTSQRHDSHSSVYRVSRAAVLPYTLALGLLVALSAPAIAEIQTSDPASPGVLDTQTLDPFPIFDGDVFENVFVTVSSHVNFMGGTVNDRITLNELATLTMTGGAVNRIDLLLINHADISGGMVAEISVASQASVNIFGSDFAVDGVPVGLGLLSATSGTLTGTLLDGSVISTVFSRDQEDASTVELLPEPATAGLLAVGALLLMPRRRRTA